MNSLAKHVHLTYFDDLPDSVVEVTKKSIMDTLGVIIAGSSVKGCRLLVDYIREWEGREESTIAVFGDKVPSALAAQANGAMARAWEIDDVIDTFPLHPGASIVPACLAAAERQGAVDGKSFITAVALGYDLEIRLAHSIKISPILSGRYNLFKVFALTGAAGKLLCLSERELLNAMGIVYSQMAADAKAARDGVMTSYIHEGTRAKSAVEAVLMAKKGITGTKDVLEGPYGFYDSYEPDPNTKSLHFELGKTFEGINTAIKFYSSCRCTHQTIDLTKKALEQGVTPASVESIIVRVNDQTYDLVCNPLSEKLKPQTTVAAQFSLPFTVAAALVKGDVFIDEVSETVIHDPVILNLASKVSPILDPERQSELSLGTVEMEINTNDGKKHVLKSEFPKGNPKNPASMEECIDKFRKSVKHSALPFQKKQAEAIIDTVKRLEQLDDIVRLSELLVPS